MAPLKGVHRVRMAIASGFAEYWYAWRGGPQILAVTARSRALVDIKVNAAAAEAGRRFFEIAQLRKTPSKGFIHGLAWAWMQSPEFAAVAERTRKDRRRLLAVIQQDLGTMPIAALDARGARKALIAWRNRYKARPSYADHLAATLSQLLGWARDQGETAADPMREWPWIYRVDRSGVIWAADELEALCLAAEPDLQRAVLLAAYSGLRQSDLIALTWSAIGDGVIIRRTSKRGRVVHIPITPALRRVLDACPGGDCLQVLTRDGLPWKVTTLQKRFRLARAAAAKKAPEIAKKRWHDLRGTFATSLVRAGVPDADVDRIMGWSPGQSEQTRACYVTATVVAEAAIARLNRSGQA